MLADGVPLRNRCLQGQADPPMARAGPAPSAGPTSPRRRCPRRRCDGPTSTSPAWARGKLPWLSLSWWWACESQGDRLLFRGPRQLLDVAHHEGLAGSHGAEELHDDVAVVGQALDQVLHPKPHLAALLAMPADLVALLEEPGAFPEAL